MLTASSQLPAALLLSHGRNTSKTNPREKPHSYKSTTQLHQFHDSSMKPCSVPPSNPKESTKENHWNAQIKQQSQSNSPHNYLLLFHQLLSDGAFLDPDHLTFPFLINACRGLSAAEEGRQIHAQAVKFGLGRDVFVQRALVRMYAKTGNCDGALRVLDHCPDPGIVPRNDLISGCWRNGEVEAARRVFDGMEQRNVVSWSIMVDGCGHVEDARQIFDGMPEKNVVAWTVMISGYAQNCFFKAALEMFLQMQIAGVDPNEITLVSVLSAVAQLGALTQGRWIHAYIERKRIEVDGVLSSALVNMYSKCGCIKEALGVFESLKCKELSAWNSIILGLAAHGLGEDALIFFSRMQEDSSVSPNDITFVGVLNACSHAGLVDEGQLVFDLLTNFYKRTPNISHYGCMVDLLGRSGHLEDAKELVENMPMEPNSVIWNTLLGACRIHKNVEMAEHISRVALESGPQDSGFYAIASNVFADAGRWDNVGNLRRQMNDLKVQKVAGCSWIEVDGEVHEFLMGRESFHAESEEILSMVAEMEKMMSQEHYGTNASKASIFEESQQ
ncbi:hypothetical protein MRB53_028963 [Persea americana]|uniref:Uncharacterized protein n=1 Tax=Persea americana TaxID=3435 RepID=A0ACC2KH04_PERAE|nr:hypothetical protein MRB53_028963 [Persea americana]